MLIAKKIAMPPFKGFIKISVASGAGNTGKTVLTSNLALISGAFYRTTLLDADTGMDSFRANGFLPNLAYDDPYTVGNYMNSKIHDFQKIVRSFEYDLYGGHHHLQLIPGSLENIYDTRRLEDFTRRIDMLNSQLTFIDGGAGTDNPGFAFHATADVVLVVVTNSLTAVDDAASVIATIYQQHAQLRQNSAYFALKAPRIKLICNKMQSPEEAQFIVTRLNHRLMLRDLPQVAHTDVYPIGDIPALHGFSRTSKKLLMLDPAFVKNSGAGAGSDVFLKLFLQLANECSAIATPRPFNLFQSMMRAFTVPEKSPAMDIVNEENISALKDMYADSQTMALLRSGVIEMENSGKAGMGKTINIAHRASYLINQGQAKRVLILELSRQQNAHYTHYATLFNNYDVLTPTAIDAAAPAGLSEGIDLLYFKQDADMSPAKFLRKLLRQLNAVAAQYDRIIIDSASGIMVRNLLLNLLINKTILTTNINDAEARDKTVQYLKRLAFLANIFSGQTGHAFEKMHVVLAFNLLDRDWNVDKVQTILTDMLSVLSVEEKEALAIQSRIVLYPTAPEIQQVMSCDPQSAYQTERKLLTEHERHAQSGYVRAVQRTVQILYSNESK